MKRSTLALSLLIASTLGDFHIPTTRERGKNKLPRRLNQRQRRKRARQGVRK